MAFISRFPGYCAECGTYVAAGAGVYVAATVNVYCAAHAPDDLYNRLADPAHKPSALDALGSGPARARARSLRPVAADAPRRRRAGTPKPDL